MLTSSRNLHAPRTAQGDLRRWVDHAERLRHPWMVGATSGAGALVVALLRLAVVGRGDPGRFVLAGSRFVAPGAHPGVPVIAGNGYDGQFYYRLALGPFNFAPVVRGMHMDSAVRFERIAYPFLAWVAAGGRAGLVPWSLIAVNVVGLGALGWLGATFARDASKPPLWGFLVPAYFGFVWSLSRDLTEIVEATFIVAGLLAVRRARPVVAGVLLAAAVLSRETALVVVGCIAVAQLWQWVGPRRASWGRFRPLRPVTWLLPLAAFGAWQAVAGAHIGHLPLAASGQHNLGPPFVGMVRGFAHYARLFPSKSSVLWFGELVVLGVVVSAAARSVADRTVALHERLAWIGYGIVTICLAPGIWLGDVGFRSLDDLYILSALIVVAGPRRTRLVAPCVGISWLIVAVELIKVI